jgi:predicted nucleic acid-binding protein
MAAMARISEAVRHLTVETHQLGLEIAEPYGLSIYDAMITSAATLAGCDRLWSQDMQDMQDGMKIGNGLRVEDPFR